MKKDHKIKMPEKAVEARRTYYEYDGIRDTRIGWTKRLGLSPNGFGNRLKLFKAGKITPELLFRPAGHEKQVHTKYELKMPRKDFIASRIATSRKTWEKRDRCPTNVTVRIWETVYRALKALKPAKMSWSQFFIDRLDLDVPVPNSATYARYQKP